MNDGPSRRGFGRCEGSWGCPDVKTGSEGRIRKCCGLRQFKGFGKFQAEGSRSEELRSLGFKGLRFILGFIRFRI